MLRLLDRLQPLALLVLRIVLGVIMIGHGYPKVFGGLSEHVHHVSNLGLPGWLAYCSAAAEFFGGILLLVGLFTRICRTRHFYQYECGHLESALEEWSSGKWRISIPAFIGCHCLRANFVGRRPHRARRYSARRSRH